MERSHLIWLSSSLYSQLSQRHCQRVGTHPFSGRDIKGWWMNLLWAGHFWLKTIPASSTKSLTFKWLKLWNVFQPKTAYFNSSYSSTYCNICIGHFQLGTLNLTLSVLNDIAPVKMSYSSILLTSAWVFRYVTYSLDEKT